MLQSEANEKAKDKDKETADLGVDTQGDEIFLAGFTQLSDVEEGDEAENLIDDSDDFDLYLDRRI